MTTPQTGIFALGTGSHAYLELDLRPGTNPSDAVSLVAGLREPRTTIGGVNLVAGFRPELWSKVAPNAAPAGVAGFNSPLVGPSGYTLFGRRKADSQELDPRPPTSHVARTDQDEFGKIFRRNVAYGTLTDHGTIFVGFSRDQAILQRMLESMVGLGDGPSDRLTTVTRALTGAYYLIPSADALVARAGPGAGDDAA